MKYYLMIFGEYDADPEVEGPFPTLADRVARADQVWDESVTDDTRLLLADVGTGGELSLKSYP